MTKTFITVVVIIIIILAFIWLTNQSANTESYIPINNVNNNNRDMKEMKEMKEMNEMNRMNNGTCNDLTENSDDLDNTADVKENEHELIIDDSIVTFDNTRESDDQIRQKFITRNHVRKPGYKIDNYANGKRDGNYDRALDYIDESNDLMQSSYITNDQFHGNDETKGQWAPYKPERKHVNKYKASEIFNSQNYLPNEKSFNPDWFDIVPDAISVKNRHLINVSKPIGINTIGTSLRNPSYDIRGAPPNPKFVISPWLQSTIEPDTNFKSLCA